MDDEPKAYVWKAKGEGMRNLMTRDEEPNAMDNRFNEMDDDPKAYVWSAPRLRGRG